MIPKIRDEWAYRGHRSDFKWTLIITIFSFICFMGIGSCIGLLVVAGDGRWITFMFPWAFMGSCVVGFWCATYEHWKWMKLVLGDKR